MGHSQEPQKQILTTTKKLKLEFFLLLLQVSFCGQGGECICLDNSSARGPRSIWRGFCKDAQAVALRRSTDSARLSEPRPRRVWNPHKAALGSCQGLARRRLRDGHGSLFHSHAAQYHSFSFSWAEFGFSRDGFSLALKVSGSRLWPPPTAPRSSLWVSMHGKNEPQKGPDLFQI